MFENRIGSYLDHSWLVIFDLTPTWGWCGLLIFICNVISPSTCSRSGKWGCWLLDCNILCHCFWFCCYVFWYLDIGVVGKGGGTFPVLLSALDSTHLRLIGVPNWDFTEFGDSEDRKGKLDPAHEERLLIWGKESQKSGPHISFLEWKKNNKLQRRGKNEPFFPRQLRKYPPNSSTRSSARLFSYEIFKGVTTYDMLRLEKLTRDPLRDLNIERLNRPRLTRELIPNPSSFFRAKCQLFWEKWTGGKKKKGSESQLKSPSPSPSLYLTEEFRCFLPNSISNLKGQKTGDYLLSFHNFWHQQGEKEGMIRVVHILHFWAKVQTFGRNGEWWNW